MTDETEARNIVADLAADNAERLVEACAKRAENFTPIMYGSDYNKGFMAAQKAIARSIRAISPQLDNERLVEALKTIRDYPNHIPLGFSKVQDIAKSAIAAHEQH
jgi:hypothetical protein